MVLALLLGAALADGSPYCGKGPHRRPDHDSETRECSFCQNERVPYITVKCRERDFKKTHIDFESIALTQRVMGVPPKRFPESEMMSSFVPSLRSKAGLKEQDYCL